MTNLLTFLNTSSNLYFDIYFQAIAEGVALMVQCFVSISLVVLVPHGGLISFSLAQVSFLGSFILVIRVKVLSIDNLISDILY